MKLLLSTAFVLCLFISKTSLAQVEAFEEEVFGGYLAVRDLALGENEMYFSIQSVLNELSAIAFCTKTKKGWSEATLLSLSGSYMDLEPFLSPSGLQLYFASNRPIHLDSTKSKDYNIWYAERASLTSSWSDPIPLGSAINSSYNEFYPAIGNTGSIYFTSDRPGSLGKDDIFLSVWNGQMYESAIPLGEEINSPGYEFNAFISPDEKTMIYSAYNREDGYGSGDLYISKKDENGNWTSAKNMGVEVNSDKMDYCPFYDPKTSTLYFTSKRSAINSSEGKEKNIEQFLNEVNKYENGLSRIYKIKLDL